MHIRCNSRVRQRCRHVQKDRLMIVWGQHCTGVPDRLLDYDMSGCCQMHDTDYAEQIKARAEADLDLLW